MCNLKIKFPRGNTAYYKITPKLNGENYNLNPTDEIKLTVKSKYSNDILIEKVIFSENLTVKFSPADTQNLNFGNYVFDCAININGDFFTFIKKSDFVITPVITEVFNAYDNGEIPLEIPELSGDIETPENISNEIATIIDENSTNLLAAGAKAVFDFVTEKINYFIALIFFTDDEYNQLLDKISDK
jgi:hypothetical protein